MGRGEEDLAVYRIYICTPLGGGAHLTNVNHLVSRRRGGNVALPRAHCSLCTGDGPVDDKGEFGSPGLLAPDWPAPPFIYGPAASLFVAVVAAGSRRAILYYY